MSSSDEQVPARIDHAGGDRALSKSARLAQAAMALLHCRTSDEVYRVAGRFLGDLMPDAIIVINEATPHLEALISRSVVGIDDSLLGKAAKMFGVEVVGARWDMLPEYRGEVLSGELVQLEGGLVELVSRETPRPLALGAVKLIGDRTVFTIGIADGEHAVGSIRILARPTDSVPVHTIESFARHCYSALYGIRRAEDLARSAESNSLILRNMSEGLALHEIILGKNGEPRDYRFLDVNPAFETLTGLAAERILGRTALDVLPGLDSIWIERYGAVAITGVPARFEDYAREIDRHIGVVAYSPQPGQFVTVIEDITEQKNANEALRQSHDMIVNLTAMVPGVVYQYQLNPDGSSAFPFASRGIEDIYEVTPEQVREDATPVFGRLHPDDAELVSDLIFESARTLEPFHCEFRVVLPKQGIRWRLSDAVPQRTEDGGTLWYGIISDITERKTLEMELRESEAQLKKAQHFARVGSWSWEIKTNHLEWSDEMFSLFGLDRATFSGDLAEVIATAIHPDDRARVDASNLAVITDAQPEPIEYRIVLPTGEVRVVWAEAGEFLLDEDGAPAILSGTVQDITERKRAEEAMLSLNEELERRVQKRTEEFRATNERLVEATRAKSDFLASMSHELRTPLNSIIGFSGLLLRGLAGELNDEQSLQIGMVNSSGRYLLALVDDILDLSRIESGSIVVEIQEIDVGALVGTVREMVRPLAEAKGLEFELTHDSDAATLRSDARLLTQILTNLLGNAIKFTDSGFVSLGVSVEDGRMVFAVRDTGRGIPEADLPRIMERFYQVKPRDEAKSKGTGLGLAISTEIAAMIGAEIEVASDLGVGSEFTLRVPLDAE